MIKVVLFGILFIFTISFCYGDVIINEIMYNPIGTDSGKEWIEIYSNQSVNVSGWRFYESNTNHKLTLINGSWIIEGYAIIVNNIEKFFVYYPNFNGTLFKTSFSLKNSGEYIAIKNSSLDIIDEISYLTEFANGNSKSLEWLDSAWYESLDDGGTPGRNNSVIAENRIDNNDCDLSVKIYVEKIIFNSEEEFGFKVIIEKEGDNKTNITLFRQIVDESGEVIKNYNDLLTTINKKKTLTYSPNLGHGTYLIKTNITHSSCNDTNLTNNYAEKLILIRAQETPDIEDYSHISINEFLPDPEGDDGVPMIGGEWVELYNSGEESIDVKGLILNDDFGNGLEISEVNVVDSTIIDSYGFLTIYRNGNGKLELNNNGSDQVILSYEDIVIDSVRYSDAIEGNSYAYIDGIGWQHTKPTPSEENINHNDVKESSFEIIDIYDLGSDNIAEFGQVVRVKIDVYRGDNAKSVLRMWVEDEKDKISKESKITIPSRYTQVSLAVPIQLEPNCNEGFDDGDYYVKIGWTSSSETEDMFEFRVEGIDMDNCETIEVEKKEKKGKLSYDITEMPYNVYLNDSFDIFLEIDNDDDDDAELEVWSYVYRGSKKYSDGEKSNLKYVNVDGEDTKEVRLENKMIVGNEGDYKLKVKIKKKGRKTTYDKTKEIHLNIPEKIIEKGEKVSLLATDEGEVEKDDVDREEEKVEKIVKKNVIVYESDTFFIKKAIPVFLATVFLFSIIFSIVCLRK